MRRSTLIAMALLLVPTLPAAAQFPAEVVSGSRVRLIVPDTLRQQPLVPRQQLIFGTVASIGGDTLYLSLPYTTGALAIPRASVRQLSVSRGVPGRFESALRHGLSWAIAGAASVYFANESHDDPTFDSAGEALAVGAGAGFVVGAVLGAISPSERWRRLRLRD